MTVVGYFISSMYSNEIISTNKEACVNMYCVHLVFVNIPSFMEYFWLDGITTLVVSFTLCFMTN